MRYVKIQFEFLQGDPRKILKRVCCENFVKLYIYYRKNYIWRVECKFLL